jgi:hypothetical protein
MLLTTTVSRVGHWQIAEEIFRVCFAGVMDFQGLDNLEKGERDGDDGATSHHLLQAVKDTRLSVSDALSQSILKRACLFRVWHAWL